MIVTDIKDLENYKNLIPCFKEIQKIDFKNLEPGKYEIDKDNYFFIFEKDSMDKNVYECHKKYIDIHVPIEGQEIINFTSHSNVAIDNPYKAEDDVELGDKKTDIESTLILPKQQIAIFLPGEPHKPWLKFKKNEKVKKAVIKVLWKK